VRGRILLALALGLLLGAGSVTAVWSPWSSHGPAPRVAVIGRVVLPDGRGVPGANVTLYVQPNPAVIAKLKPGDRIPQVDVGTAVTSGDGSYGIAPANWAAIMRSATYGTVNFELMAQDSCHVWMTMFGSQIIHTSTGPALDSTSAGSEPPQLTPLHAHLVLTGPATAKCSS